MQQNDKAILVNFSKWILKVLIQLSILVSLFLLLHLGWFNQKGSFEVVLQRFDQAVESTANFKQLYALLGWQPVAALLLVSIIFLFFWLFQDKSWYTHLPSVFRDLFVIYIFTAFTASFYQNHASFLNMAVAITIYLTVAVANFGGLLEPAEDALKDLGRVGAVLLAGSLLSTISGRIPANPFSAYFLDLAMVYIIGFNLKILFFPDNILTFEIAQGKRLSPELRRMGFAILSLLVLFPLAGLFFALIFKGIFGLAALLFPLPGISGGSVSSGLRALFSPPALSGLYLIRLLTNPIALITFIAALLAHLRQYAFYFRDDPVSHKTVHDAESQNLLINTIVRFPFSLKETLPSDLLAVGMISFIFNALLLFMFISGVDILEPIMALLGL